METPPTPQAAERPARFPARFSVDAGDTGVRLDAFLAGRLAISRAEARRLLVAGGVRLDGRPVGAGEKGNRVETGSEVAVEAFTPPGERRPLPEPEQPLSVLARGPGWIAVDKPAGAAVHPFREDETGCVLNALVARHPEIVGVGEGALRSGVVHRLDVETSGVLLFATEEERWRRLRGAFSKAKVTKHYRAIVCGRLEGKGALDLSLVVAQHRPARVRVARPGEEGQARSVRLDWRALESADTASLVELRPHTGFLHQIRASLAHLGHPVAGDPAYGPGPEADATGAPRSMLHAARVRWRDVAAASPDPPDFVALWSRLGS